MPEKIFLVRLSLFSILVVTYWKDSVSVEYVSLLDDLEKEELLQ